MGEAETISVDLQDPRVECARQPGLGLSPDGSPRRDSDGRAWRVRRRPVPPRAPGRSSRSRRSCTSSCRSAEIGSSSPGSIGRRAARARSQARARRTDSRPRPPRRAGVSAAGKRPETRSQQLVERTDAERPERDRHEPLFRNASSHPGGNLVARRQDRCHRLQLETSHREAKHRHRRRIEPLHVVDCEHDPLVGGKHSQGVQEGEGDHALVCRRPLGVRERERGLERPSLRPWKLRLRPRRCPRRSGRTDRQTRTEPRLRRRGTRSTR